MRTFDEKIIILIEKIDKSINLWINRLIKESTSFEIVRIISFKSELIGQLLECGLKISDVRRVSEINFDSIILYCEDYAINRKKLIEEFGVSKERISRHTSIFFLPESSNLGSISLEKDVLTGGCWVDINYLVKKHLIYYQNDLEKFYFENEHNVIDKWLHYFEIYDRFFSKYREKKMKMLEIGVSKGGSLQMWKNYFGKKATIVGVDIDPNCKAFEEENILIEIGSQEDRRFLQSLVKKYGPFDIVLDDGGHTMKQQITSFEELFPAVNNGGVYLCEDCHTSYWRGHKGGVKRRGTFIEYMKDRIDDLNAQHIEAIYDLIRSKSKHSKILIKILNYMPKWILHLFGIFNIRFKPSEIVKNQLWSIQFYDSMVVVEKRKVGKSFSVALLR